MAAGVAVLAWVSIAGGGRAAVLGGSQRAGGAPLHVFGTRPTAATTSASLAKLDGFLVQLAQAYPSLGADRLQRLRALNPAARLRLVSSLGRAEVAIDATAQGDVAQLRSALVALGLEQPSTFLNSVGGWLPLDALPAAAALPGLRLARAAMPRKRSGPVAVQGDYVQQSSLIRSTYPSLTGAGVTVGVLSDSFDCFATYEQPGSGVPASGGDGYAPYGFTATYADDEASGALPSGVTYTDPDCLQYGQPLEPPFSDEGRAILQIVHAIAPGAGLMFYTGDNSESAFANGITTLAQQGAKVIDDDLGYPDEPFFQDGLIAQAVDQVAAQGVAYFSSAGNDGNTPSPGNYGPFAYDNTAPQFVSSAGQQLLNFDTSGTSTATSLPMSIPALQPGWFVFLVLQWDQPYVTGAPDSGGAKNALNLCISSSGSDPIYDDDGNAVSTGCAGANAIGNDPVLILIIANPANATQNTQAETVNAQVSLVSGAAPGRIKLLLAGDGIPVAITQYAAAAPTIQGHPGASGAAAVGAAFYFQTPKCGTSPAILEYYSSQGGDPILFDSSGTRLATPVTRDKPDFVSPDGVNNTFLGQALPSSNPAVTTGTVACQTNDSYPSFFGTSAAAPHAAATAALIFQALPSITAAQILQAMRSTTANMGSVSGFNFTSGNGFMQADAALAQPVMSLSPASVTVGSQATLSWTAYGATSCTASGAWSGSQAAQGNQTITTSTVGTQTYSLSCDSPLGTGSNQVSLTVNAQSSSSSSSAPSSSDPKGGGGALDGLSLLALAMLIGRYSARRRRNRLGLATLYCHGQVQCRGGRQQAADAADSWCLGPTERRGGQLQPRAR